ncbi:MAG: VOC family protein [Gammaproteobacteria bacterium]|nr:VOC family protein [Gammaproteobacteria bacterium]
MSVQGLGYVRISATDLAAWRKFAVDTVGMMPAMAPDGSLWLRVDDRPFRFVVEQGSADRFVAAGWEMPSQAHFIACVEGLRRAGVAVRDGTAEEARARCANAVAMASDPAGNAFELYWGRVRAYDNFVSAVGVSGFVVGDLGLGHVVLPAPQLDETASFYKSLLGFGDTDEMRLAMSPDPAVPELRLQFLHAACRRHHSVALIPMPAPSGLIHTMVEMREVDDVGRALDRCVAAGYHISSSLGRHSNDGMLGFYVATPGGFDLEIGCMGLTPDWNTWVPTRSLIPSIWGHQWSAPPQ